MVSMIHFLCNGSYSLQSRRLIVHHYHPQHLVDRFTPISSFHLGTIDLHVQQVPMSAHPIPWHGPLRDGLCCWQDIIEDADVMNEM